MAHFQLFRNQLDLQLFSKQVEENQLLSQAQGSQLGTQQKDQHQAQLTSICIRWMFQYQTKMWRRLVLH